MAALIPNIAKGRFARYADLAGANDALLWVLFASAGLETDVVLRDKDSLADVVVGTTDEATFAGYVRVTATAVVVTVDDTNDRVDVDAADPSWSPTAAQALGKIGLFLDPDTTVGVDADLIPMFLDDYVLTTPTTGTISYQVAATGWGRAA